MNRWISRASVLFLAANVALACGDGDDGANSTGSGGSAGKGGSSGKGGSAGEGEGGTPEPGSGGEGGAPAPAACEAPKPPGAGGGEGGGGGASTAPEGLAIAGRYVDDFDGEHVITNAIWTNYGVYNISQFDNEERYVIARNDETNTSSPCAWSRFDWTYDGDDLYYCQSAYAAESEEAALETEPADADDLEEGCSGFPWSKLTPQ